jgi:hypothetical protein
MGRVKMLAEVKGVVKSIDYDVAKIRQFKNASTVD